MRFAISAGGLGAAVFALLVHSAAANTPATKGVHPDQITLYSGPGDFDCADGSGKISMAQVNDEYCDCSDGSDEPGTSACQNGKFWCKNFQHRGLYLFSSRVNDGVCDCCDGSDEHNGVAVCEDRCAEEGREIREALVKKIDLLEQGILKRPEYVERATSFKQGIETRTAELTKTIQETEEKMNEKQKTIDELQKVVDGEKEARAPEEGEKRRSVEVRQKLRQDVRDARRAHELAVKHQLEEVARAAQLVKDAEQAPPQGEGGGEEVHAAQDESGAAEAEPVAPHSVDPEQMVAEEGEDAERRDAELREEEGGEGDGGEDVDQDDGEGEGLESGYDQAGEDGRVSAEDEEERRLKEEEDKEVAYPESESEVLLREAESAIQTIRDDKSKHENDLETTSKVLEGDFGPDSAYMALYDKCFSQQVQQYTYEVCMFRNAHQKDGAATNIGNWGNWNDASEGRPYSVMHFTNGGSCWNGPSRTLKVTLQCGIDEFVVSVQEPNKCVYEMEFQTPLACGVEEVEKARHELQTQFGGRA